MIDTQEINHSAAAPLAPQPHTPDERHVDKTVLALLLDEERGEIWSVSELVREIGGLESDTLDSIARLHGAGLIHRIGEFAFATRAAVVFEEVAG